ncbi:MAG: diguanylate cyclase, partial [Deltaproteobacteria bacterium]
PFALCHVDLDNFKPFVDKYGYAWGSELIKEVANILENRVDNVHDDDVFIGHIGGDDFVIVAEPEKAHKISQQLVREFAPSLCSFYSEQDRENGFIIGKDRKGSVLKFPLITVTIAIVNSDDMHFANPLAMAKKAAQIKEYGKTLSGSNFVTMIDYKKIQQEKRSNESV